MRFVSIIIILILSTKLFSQVIPEPNDVEKLIIEELGADQYENHIYDQLDLDRLKANPLDMEGLTDIDLQVFPWLTEVDRQSIAQYIKNHKPLLSLYELQSIKGIEKEKIKLTIPYLRLGITNKKNWAELLSLQNASLIFRWARVLQKQEGYIRKAGLESDYFGSQDKTFLRFQNQLPGFFSYGIILEKDAGEAWWQNKTNTRIDYLSAHFSLQNIHSRLPLIVVGDYTVRFGQGLIMDNSFSVGRTAQLGSIIKTPSILKPYQSLSENNMLRGVGAAIRISKSTKLLSFYSINKMDANIITEPDLEEDGKVYFSSIDLSGLHRTVNELSDHNSILQSIGGLSLQKEWNRNTIGINSVLSHQNLEQNPENRLDQIFLSKKKNQAYYSVHYQRIWKQFTFFGENGVNSTGQKALLNGCLVGLGKKLDALGLVRQYDPGFKPIFNSAYASGSETRNEKGFLFGLNLYPIKRWQITLFADHWSYPWSRYQIQLPSFGKEYHLRLSLVQKRKWTIYGQLSYKFSQENLSSTLTEGNEVVLVNLNSRTFRIHFESKLNPDFTWRTRFEYRKFTRDDHLESGKMIYSDLLYKSMEHRYSGSLRFAVFESDGYDSRIYAYENDLLYQFNIPAYFGNGVRAYLNFKCRFGKQIHLESRISNTYYFHQNKNGSGGETINSPYKTELKFQIRYTF